MTEIQMDAAESISHVTDLVGIVRKTFPELA